jgi:hypothetical protein
MIRQSYPANHPFAGYDIHYQYIIPPISGGNEVRHVLNRLDFAIVMTQLGEVFKYYVGESGIEALAEQIWDVGLEAIDSIIDKDGVIYFLGRKGNQVSWWMWDGQNKPIDIGLLIRPTIDLFLASPDVDKAKTKGIYIPNEKKYLATIPVIRT